MTRTAKKAKTVTVATVEDMAADAEIRSVGEAVADVVAALPAPDAAIVAAEAANTPEVETTTETVTGREVLIPLNKLTKSPRNARKTPHGEETVETYAASIAAKGILQNLVVEPELDADGTPTGFYFVTIGEGRRLAQMLRAKRKEIKRTEPIRCVIDTANDPFEISLDENVSRTNLLPADQFEAFLQLSQDRGWGAEEIAARFGITAHVVKQRLKLGAVSPKLMQVYRDGELTLDQLQAFAITDDHARQEQIYAGLGYNREPWIIRRDLTRMHVQANDRLAVFVGPEAYTEAGGTIVRDLFTEDRGGYYDDAALLDRLVLEKLEGITAEVQAEGWKWAEASIDFPHAHGFRRVYPHSVELSEEDAAAYAEGQDEFDRLTAEWEDTDDDLPPDVDERFAELEAEIERIDGLRHAYDTDEIARGGAFVVLNHDGTARIERGFIRPEDEAPEPEEDADGETVIYGMRVNADGEIIEDSDYDEDGNHVSALDAEDEDAEDDGRPISDLLTRDLTAHRTLGLRLALGEQPDMALIAVTHALAAQTFYRGVDAHALEIRPSSAQLGGHADGIEDTATAKLLADRHSGWAADMPQDVADLWGFIAGLDPVSVMALFAHCASLTVNALKLPWENQKRRAHATADRLATALVLDMSQHWTPTVSTYLGRVTKAHILAAVREAVGDEATERLSGMKKQAMAEAAEQLLAGTGWLPPLLRTERPAWLDVPQAEADADAVAEAPEVPEPDAADAAEPEAMDLATVEDGSAVEEGEAFNVAAE
ncbi:ParB/RepB/Spo0J family partition protein [Rhizobium lentis]|uniref:ParB/RepB/Spo0J family partition protein n=1 Tax=Rhizobium lentis TaxID=1138194 RepID=UPI001C82C4F4|nr:ParB/Srx family N-terminal domain-containing protein [Rhizobium lentis]MBX5086734.1 ParB/RepB/Spo0J family partition protein [Rhizobium lentis]MBX5099379.1 ParB/RepB/Spo0J family partition protein [Rhizobium lentis]MBX5124296.1 ParB/RepB/Spo0J family partition protein [Rhizobium lentis]